MVVAHEGRVEACVCFEVVRTWYARGPSSVLRVVEDPTMRSMAERICAALGTSGFCGFDFFLETETQELVMIEMNTRPTQLVHLPCGEGKDMVAAYLRAVMGLPCQDRPKATGLHDCVALFPQEMLRDPESELLVEAFHDVPWECPALVEQALGEVPESLRDDPHWNG